jgi:uncharacterized protein
MLGSVARKLRIFGFDTLYFAHGKDLELERIGRDEGRVILTSDLGLFESARRKNLRAFLVEGRTERARLRSLAGQAAINSLELVPGETRCALCNGELGLVSREEVDKELPPSISSRHRVYYRCGVCRKLYWKGRHWERLRRLSPLLQA